MLFCLECSERCITEFIFTSNKYTLKLQVHKILTEKNHLSIPGLTQKLKTRKYFCSLLIMNTLQYYSFKKRGRDPVI